MLFQSLTGELSTKSAEGPSDFLQDDAALFDLLFTISQEPDST